MLTAYRYSAFAERTLVSERNPEIGRKIVVFIKLNPIDSRLYL
jgi:hypothetical protein